MMQCQEHKPFAGTKCFLKAEPLLKMSSAADDHEQHGQVTTQHEYKNLFDRRLTVKMIADEVNVNREAVRRIVTEELGTRKICAKMVPRNLTEQQRDARVSICAELLEEVEDDPELMKRVITGDES